MSKKFLIRLIPLLVIAALAVVPAAAQAVTHPHWFKNGVRQAGAKPIPVLTWGGAVNLSQESPAGEINCKGAGAGQVENPKGASKAEEEKGEAPAGIGKSLLAAFYECKEPKCEAEVKEKLGALGYSGVGFAVTYNFPWNNELKGAAAPFEETLGAPPNKNFGKGFAEGYPAKQQEPGGFGESFGAAGAIGAVVGCEIFPNPEGAAALGGVKGKPERVAAEIPFEGELHPNIGGATLNEAGNAAKPAKTEFLGKASGELEDPLGPGAGGSNSGQVKYGGYTVQDGITVAE